MVVRKNLAVPYAVIVIADASGGEVPEYVAD